MVSIDDTARILTDRGDLTLYEYYNQPNASVYFYHIAGGVCKAPQKFGLRIMDPQSRYDKYLVKTEHSPEGVWVTNMIATEVYWAYPMVGMETVRLDPVTKGLYIDKITDVTIQPISDQEKARYRLIDNITIGVVINGFPSRAPSDAYQVLNR